jgi:hypothetical protein
MTNISDDKLQQLDNRLKELRKEVEGDLLKYKDKGWLCGDIPKMKCIWDSIPIADRYKPMCLSCPCPKCSAYC